ncbi:MAG: hypothetical protein ACREDY_04065 [Bradyrhizobium sp.]
MQTVLSEPKSPADYIKLVAAHSATTTLRSHTSKPLEVSGLRRIVLPQPGDWVACVRAWNKEQPVYMAYFFKGDAIVDYRGQVLFDRCEEATYTPLDRASGPSAASLQ